MEVFISICEFHTRTMSVVWVPRDWLRCFVCCEREYPSLFGLCSERRDLEKHKCEQGFVARLVRGFITVRGSGKSSWGGCQWSENWTCQGLGPLVHHSYRPIIYLLLWEGTNVTVIMWSQHKPWGRQSNVSTSYFPAKETEEKSGLWLAQVPEQAIVGSWNGASSSQAYTLPAAFPSSLS